jgi:hypothetical protein
MTATSSRAYELGVPESRRLPRPAEPAAYTAFMSRARGTYRLLLVGVLVVAGAACSDSSGSAGSGEPSASSFKITTVDVQSPTSPPPVLPDPTRAGVQATLNRYLSNAVLTPLRSGKTGDLAPVFTAGATSRLAGPDRAALVDEGLPKSDDVKANTATATLSALAGSTGDIPIVAANVKVQVVSGSGADAMTIDRSGDLIFVNEGGTWKIDGYDIRVARDSGGATTTTSAHK